MSSPNKILLSTLRGPLWIPGSNSSEKQKYVRFDEKCGRCFKLTPKIKISNYSNYDSNKSSLNSTLRENTPLKSCINQKMPIQNIRKMINENAHYDRIQIYKNNPRLTARMHSFQTNSNTYRSITPNNPNRDQKEQTQNRRGLSSDLDSELAQSAIRHIQGSYKQDDQQWEEFMKNYPKEAEMVISFTSAHKKKNNRKVEMKKDQSGVQEGPDKSTFNLRDRRNSLGSSYFLRSGIKSEFKGELDSTQNSAHKKYYFKENLLDQPYVVLDYVLNGQKYCQNEQNILAKWIFTLPQEIRMEIEKDKKFFPIPRNIDQASIRKGLDELYGSGKQRRLRPGEEALIMETILSFLQECLQNLQLLTSSFQVIIQQILKNSGLEDLNECPLCMKQVECHWKLMATRFKYVQLSQFNQKKNEKVLNLAQNRGHFLDLTKTSNKLVQFLLKNQSESLNE